VKAISTAEVATTAAQVSVYFVDTGAWTVHIKAELFPSQAELSPALDDFVRQQPWDSLELSEATCAAAACAPVPPCPS
jgi:hypothetical protein